MKSDRQLVRSALGGDRAAAASLIRRYEKAVYATAMSVLRDHHLAEDVTQESLFNAMFRLDSLREADRFGGWLIVSTRRLAFRASEKESRRRAVTNDVETLETRASKWSEEDFDLMNMIADLPEHEQVVVLMKNLRGHTAMEIAEITGRPVGTVTKQLSRAYKRLRKQLTEVEQ